MPELPFPDVAGPAAHETVPPEFEQIVERAHARRRRGVVSVVAGTAMVVVAVALGGALTHGDSDAAPEPTRPSPSRPSPSASGDPSPPAATIVRTGDLVSLGAGPHGSLMSVWKACADKTDQSDEYTCHYAWRLQTSDGTHDGLARGSDPVVHPAADGAFLIDSWDDKGFVVGAAGDVRPVRLVPSGTLTPGLVFVGGKPLTAIDPVTATGWELRSAPDGGSWAGATESADGTIWAMSFRGHDLPVTWSRRPGASTWQQHVMASTDSHDSLPGYLAVAGDHVAALSGYDGATVLPVADLAITTDSGRSWTDLQKNDVPFRYVDAMAATSGGTLYVVTPGGERLYRSTDASWTRFVEVPNPTHADTLVPAGDRVIARGGSPSDPALVAFDDNGRSTPVPLAH